VATFIINKRIYLGILSGIFLEYFDYTLYGFAISYIAQAFFPAENKAIALMLSWTVFSISFLVRPLGAIVFGHFADKIGRRKILIATIFLMSISTVCMGLIPNYAQIGILAPILLLICRIVQGISVSTEYSGSSTYLLELTKTNHGLNSGILTGASGLGMFCASALFLFFGHHWREGFIIAGLIVGILGLYLRLSMVESPEFLKMKQSEGVATVPLIQLVKQHPKLTFIGILVSAYAGIIIIAIEIYLPNYLQTQFGIIKSQTLIISTYLILVEVFFAILWGYISDYIGQIKTLFIGGMLMLLFVYPTFSLFHASSMAIWLIAATLLAIFVGAVDGPIAAFLVHCFPTRIRYSGVSISYSFGAALCGGFSPIILTLLQNQSNLPMFQFYLMISAVIFLGTIMISKCRACK
jgi:MHS family proline/betaine transporter-like MFS transporter